ELLKSFSLLPRKKRWSRSAGHPKKTTTPCATPSPRRGKKEQVKLCDVVNTSVRYPCSSKPIKYRYKNRRSLTKYSASKDSKSPFVIWCFRKMSSDDSDRHRAHEER